MKLIRQAKILEIIKNNEIETQEELAEHLVKLGFTVTQATVSRDIKELKLVKVLSSSGKYKYAHLKRDDKNFSDIICNMAKEVVVAIDFAENIVSIKTISGSAQIIASIIDSLELEEVVGTIGGIDTVFVLCKSKSDVQKIINRFKKLL
ncbi:transcriptional regulator, ArgR family [Alkalithermobacter thermoalcaliphilus JW-YL-7 = DSM 7308]|uniref:Arginine repressor n=1 Tax=Alkalithermobacter thermoalcaliphilus JW-YL-7 = DSM 7308 TaxID=1121328 RepID=A0A150FQ01_CLOPD|nr:arginine repressor, ArgR [[Clostridium] paradoxum JW-YL-7 = DSM 7308]SHK66011.1 transcriptional regulator, ArgR family [[Clostridium] paradoxum JW-YL-7 = DSM 7308]